MKKSSRLRLAREARGLCQLELANAINGQQCTISEFECGYRVPSWEVAKRISKVLKVPVVKLFPDLSGDAAQR